MTLPILEQNITVDNGNASLENCLALMDVWRKREIHFFDVAHADPRLNYAVRVRDVRPMEEPQ